MPMDDHPNHTGKVWPVSPVQNPIDVREGWNVARVFAYGICGSAGLIAFCIGIVALFGKHL